MAIDILAMVAVGVFAALMLFALNHLLRRLRGRALPRWVMPAVVGAAMVGYSVWNEYSWFDRVASRLPDRVVVLNPVASGAPWRPWSYVVPVTTRFMAVDRGSVMRSGANPDLALTEILLVERWKPTARVPVVFDCRAGRRADLFQGGTLAGDGTLSGAVWVDLPPGDALLQAACNGG